MDISVTLLVSCVILSESDRHRHERYTMILTTDAILHVLILVAHVLIMIVAHCSHGRPPPKQNTNLDRGQKIGRARFLSGSPCPLHLVLSPPPPLVSFGVEESALL